MKLTKNQSHQNVTFVDGDDPFVHGYNTAVDDTRMDQDIEQAPLAEFFSRPIKIYDFAWGNITAFGQFNPWNLFFTNPRVANRLTNYNLMRATLKVKVVVNGNAFLYGRILMGYMPYSSVEGTGSNAMTNFNFEEDAVQLSQLPHIFLNPTTSTGGIITCPFFFNKNYVNIPTSEFDELGDIHYIVLNPILHTNDPTFRPPTVSVFAWAEDVQLSVLTSVDTSTLIPQSGEIATANATGVVSGPATSISRIANAMSSIPYIKPYAKATELASSTVAAIASRFGYCRPSVTKAPDFVKIHQAGSFALTNVPDTAQKLSVDHLQEATVDPRISGIEEEDMLSIVNIAKRESYIRKFTWNDSAQSGDFLWNMRVTPNVWLEGPTIEAISSYHFPATALASMPFRYWTGTLKYRFQVVCSGFHKGRLAITWDPNWIASDEPELNTMYSEIIDIAETQDFTISISNGQAFTMIENTFPGVTPYTTLSSTTRYSSFENFSNGVIGVSVVNALTTPSDALGAIVGINVFISAGDDFKVFVPDDHFQHFVFNRPPSLGFAAEEGPQLLEEQAGDLLTTGDANDSSPIGDNTHIVFDTKTGDHTNLVYTGESIPSFRAMVKRYSLWNALLPTLSATVISASTNFKYAIFPYIRGYYTNAPDFSSGGFQYAFCNTLLLHLVTTSFAGFRGNFRYKIVPRSYQGTIAGMYTYAVQRFGYEIASDEYNPPARFTMSSFANSGACSRSVISQSVNNHNNDFQLDGTNGLAWADTNTGVLEFEVPWYSKWRFAGGRHKAWAAANTWGLGGWYLFIKGLFNVPQVFDVYVAAGEDFQTYFFLGLPRMYYEPTPPAAA